MASDDVLIAVNGTPIGNVTDLTFALGTASEGKPLTSEVVRNSELFRLTAPASRRLGNGELANQLKLGAQVGAEHKDVSYRGGAVIQDIAPGSPAANSDLHVGDLVAHLSIPKTEKHPARSIKVVRVEDVEAFLEDLRNYEDVALSVVRHGVPVEAHVRLGPRVEDTVL